MTGSDVMSLVSFFGKEAMKPLDEEKWKKDIGVRLDNSALVAP